MSDKPYLRIVPKSEPAQKSNILRLPQSSTFFCFNEDDEPEVYFAITVARKYADKIASGEKPYEVRRFRTSYRGDLVITVSKEKIARCIVTLTGVQSSKDARRTYTPTPEEAPFGEWIWLLSNPRPCEPVPCKGKLGLWPWLGDLPAALGGGV